METIGSLIDKLSINELKIYHMKEQLHRDDVDDVFLRECMDKLSILNLQRKDLGDELQELMNDVSAGRKKLRIYRQLKMYNDKRYKD